VGATWAGPRRSPMDASPSWRNKSRSPEGPWPRSRKRRATSAKR
jgi:hypothetical protein